MPNGTITFILLPMHNKDQARSIIFPQINRYIIHKLVLLMSTTRDTLKDMLNTEISIRIRTNRNLKQKAAKELKKMGLTVSDAVRIYIHYIATEKKLPDEINDRVVLVNSIKGKIS